VALFVPKSSSKAFRKGWLLVSAVTLTVIVSGCGDLSHLQVFPVSIINDTGAPVVVRNCSSYCSSSPLVFHMLPGSSVPINRVAKMHKLFSITTPSGGHIGCLDLYFNTAQPGARVPVSQATACPAGRRRWKTFGLVALALLILALPFVALSRRRRLPSGD
jgi:hypothetical protein